MAEFSKKQQDAVYRAAEQAIEEARAEASTELTLSARRVNRSGSGPRVFETGFADLTRLPEQIATFTGLQSLRLDGTQVSDLAPLATLTDLQNLSLYETQVSDLAPLATLTGLQVLWLNETQVSDLAPLATLTELQTLWLNRTQVSDLVPLAALTGLQTLWLNETRVSDLAPLAAMTGLQLLMLNETPVSDLAPLATLTGLQVLWLNETQVSDLAPLAAMTGLQDLRLDQTQVSDLAPLAALTGLQTLSLKQTHVSNLAPLAALTGLQTLSVRQTQVSDIAPLADLPGLQYLTLSSSAVRDLRPLLALRNLSTGEGSGLAFADTPATRADPALHDLSQIDDPKECAEKTLAYLATLPPWPEPLDGPAAVDPPDQDPGLPLVWGPEGFTFLAAKVDSDPVTEAALEDLRSLLDDLRRKGNRHDDLFRLAGEMQDRSAGPIADLNMVRLHLSYQKLRRLYQGREARTEGFDDETVSVLGAVLEIVPGVTMADPGVKVLIERQEADRARPSAPDIVAAEDAVLAAVHADDAPFAPEVKDIAVAIRQPGFDDRLAATRGILSRNAAVVVLKYLGNVTVAGIIGNYAYTHMPEILALARTMGDDAFTWAQMVFASFRVEYEASVGILRETLTSGAIRPQRKPPKDVNEP